MRHEITIASHPDHAGATLEVLFVLCTGLVMPDSAAYSWNTEDNNFAVKYIA